MGALGGGRGGHGAWDQPWAGRGGEPEAGCDGGRQRNQRTGRGGLWRSHGANRWLWASGRSLGVRGGSGMGRGAFWGLPADPPLTPH